MCLLAMSVLFENIYLSPLPTFFFRCKAFWSSSQRDRRGGRGGLPGTHGPPTIHGPPMIRVPQSGASLPPMPRADA